MGYIFNQVNILITKTLPTSCPPTKATHEFLVGFLGHRSAGLLFWNPDYKSGELLSTYPHGWMFRIPLSPQSTVVSVLCLGIVEVDFRASLP